MKFNSIQINGMCYGQLGNTVYWNCGIVNENILFEFLCLIVRSYKNMFDVKVPSFFPDLCSDLDTPTHMCTL